MVVPPSHCSARRTLGLSTLGTLGSIPNIKQQSNQARWEATEGDADVNTHLSHGSASSPLPQCWAKASLPKLLHHLPSLLHPLPGSLCPSHTLCLQSCSLRNSARVACQSHHTGLHLQVSSERPLKPSAPFTPHSRSGLPSRVTTGPKDRGCQCELIIIVLQQPGMAGEVLPKELKKSSIYSFLEVWQDSRVPALHARSPQLYPTIP